MSRVSFERVTKRFGKVVAVNDLTLDVEDQEFLVFLGPSGCGKSTILRLIAGLEEPNEGIIAIGDRIVNELDPKVRDIAMVFQTYALYPHMSVRQNLEFPLKKRHIPKQERDQLVAQAAEGLGLGELLDRKPAQLSGGQRQRVALGRAIVRRPDVFLMDEPLSNLDAKLRVQTRAELVELQRRLATTMLYVTHDQVEAMAMASRIAVINDGVLQQVGPSEQVYDRPANVFVAQFIGSPPMNTVSGEVSRNGAGLAVRVPGGVIPLPDALAQAVSKYGLEHVIVGVRPEHLDLDGGPVQATVKTVEALGHERHIVCDLEDGQQVIIRRAADQPAPAPEEAVHLTAQTEELHIFDPATTRRLN